MRRANFNNSTLKLPVTVDDFPLKKEIMDIFAAYGYKNEFIAQRISVLGFPNLAKQEEVYKELTETLDVLVHLKMNNSVVTFDTVQVKDKDVLCAARSVLENKLLDISGEVHFSDDMNLQIVGLIYLQSVCRSVISADTIPTKDVVSDKYTHQLQSVFNFARGLSAFGTLIQQYRHGLGGVDNQFINRLEEIMRASLQESRPLTITKHVACQYLYFAITGQSVAPNGSVATPVASLINDVMVFLGYLKPLKDNYTGTEKRNRLKGYFEVDDTGQYIRVY